MSDSNPVAVAEQPGDEETACWRISDADHRTARFRGWLASAEVRRRLALEGAEPPPSTPDEYAADIDREEKLWAKVVKASGAKAN